MLTFESDSYGLLYHGFGLFLSNPVILEKHFLFGE